MMRPTILTNFTEIRALVCRHQFYKNVLRKQSSCTSTSSSSIQYFNNDEQALHFVLSSGSSDNNNSVKDDGYRDIVLPKIYSPVINFDRSKMKYADSDDNIQSLNDIIESHYTLDDRDQFVGGMGENDGGVWFVNNDDDENNLDTLDYWEEIRNVIQTVKANRHGIPFGVYTSGIIKNKDIISNLKESVGISSVQVTLGSGDPTSYSQVVGGRTDMSSNEAFGEVCNFIVQSAESGFPVTVAVAGGKHAGPGSELAKALGAVEVVIYKNIP